MQVARVLYGSEYSLVRISGGYLVGRWGWQLKPYAVPYSTWLLWDFGRVL